MRVYFSSGTHVDDISGRINKINQEIESPDIVFGEGAGSSPVAQLKNIGKIALLTPLIGIIAFTQIFIILKLRGRLLSKATDGNKGSDKEIMEKIADQYGARKREIDTVSPATPIYQSPVKWIIVNWGILASIIAVAWWSDYSMNLILGSVGVILMSGYILLHTLLYLVNRKRENAMAHEIESKSNDVDAACIVLGEVHHFGVGTRLSAQDGIDVINPSPSNPDWSTRLVRQVWKILDSILGVKTSTT